MEHLQGPELRTDRPVTSLTQATVPRGWGGFPAEAEGKPRDWKGTRVFFRSSQGFGKHERPSVPQGVPYNEVPRTECP